MFNRKGGALVEFILAYGWVFILIGILSVMLWQMSLFDSQPSPAPVVVDEYDVVEVQLSMIDVRSDTDFGLIVWCENDYSYESHLWELPLSLYYDGVDMHEGGWVSNHIRQIHRVVLPHLAALEYDAVLLDEISLEIMNFSGGEHISCEMWSNSVGFVVETYLVYSSESPHPLNTSSEKLLINEERVYERCVGDFDSDKFSGCFGEFCKSNERDIGRSIGYFVRDLEQCYRQWNFRDFNRANVGVV